MHSQHVDEFVDRAWLEHVFGPSNPRNVVGASPAHHCGVIGIMSYESLTEFIEVQSAVLVPVISLHEKCRLIEGNIDAQLPEASLDFLRSDASETSDVEKVVSIL